MRERVLIVVTAAFMVLVGDCDPRTVCLVHIKRAYLQRSTRSEKRIAEYSLRDVGHKGVPQSSRHLMGMRNFH